MGIAAEAFTIGGLTVRWYGICIVLGMIAGIWWVEREFRRQKLNSDEFLTMCIIGLPIAIIGARLYYVLANWGYYGKHWGEIFAVWNGGLAIHGGLFVGLIVAIVYTRIRKMPFFAITDAIVPGVALAQAIGRWGNYFNKEAYGSLTSLPWAINIDGAYYHPAFLYESLWDLAVFGALIWFLKRPHRNGEAMAWYFILYSFGRGIIEFIRVDRVMLGNLLIPASTLVSLACIAAAVCLLFYLRRYPKITLYQADPLPKWQQHQQAKKKKKRK